MRLSMSIQSDVLKAKAGSILNTFKIYPRRDVLFFEDILANYIRECEAAGFKKEIGDIGKKWSALEVSLVPGYMRTFAPEYLTNAIIKKVWTNLGLLDDFKVVHSGSKYVATTKNEFITRAIGKNNFMCQLFSGFAAGFHGQDTVCCEYSQTRESCKYVVTLTGKPFNLATKERETYGRLNSATKNDGLSLKTALSSGVFQLNGNTITFRGKSMLCIENSGFHLIGNSKILLDRLSGITTSFFEDLVLNEADPDKKLVLLKSILHSCGWGNGVITLGGGKIKFLLEQPPYGLQAEPDNWDFLAYFILGYLHLIDPNIVLDGTALREGNLLFTYSNYKEG